MNDTSNQGIGIVGSGLVGCLAALAFARKGFTVTLFEMRPEPKTTGISRAGQARSINLAVSERGLNAINSIDEGIASRLVEHLIPMHGRMIHDLSGKTASSKYGLFGESINSIDRGQLNEFFIEELRRQDVRILFNHKLVSMSHLEEAPKMLFSTADGETKSFEFDYVIGCDGTHSQFRYQMQKSMRMDFSQNYIDMQYMELLIPPGDKGTFLMDPNHLHIWPRHDYMLIALPNRDGSFTCTFFSPWKVIEEISTADAFVDFFHKSFPDAHALLGEDQLRSVYTSNPRGSLVQVSAYPFHSPEGRALIIGDAAHSMVPFYGQGMNCGFEDVRVLMELVEKADFDLSVAFQQYSNTRKKDVDTICKLALDNYYEMSQNVSNRFYWVRKKVDYFLGRYLNGPYFQWIPMYTMISFRSDISYSQAVEINERQNRFLWRAQVVSGLVLGGVVAARVWASKKA